MRRLFVLSAVVSILSCVGSVFADNQEEANKIARQLGNKYPQQNIEVAYQDGKVRLRGEVTSDSQKQEVVRFVQELPNIKEVKESITIASLAQPMVSPRPDFLPTQNLPSPAVVDQGRVIPVAGEQTVVLPSQLPIGGMQSFPAVGSQGQAYEMSLPPMPPAPAGKPMPLGSAGMAIGGNAAPQPAVPVGNRVGHAYQGPPQGQAMTPGQSGQPNLPNYAWPTYANNPNYSQVSYPKQYGAGAFPYVGPFYPYPQVPLGWRKVTMEWHDGYWWLDFNDGSPNGPFSPLFRHPTKYR